MTGAWPNPHRQQDHSQVPSTSDSSSPAGHRQIATQLDATVDNVIQSCACSWCSRPRYDHQAARPTREYQEPWFPTNPAAPYANQYPGIDNPTGVATITNGLTVTRPVGQQAPEQAPWDQENGWCAPHYEAVGQAHASAAPNQAQPDMSVPADGLRHFAERYFNNPESLINALHFEYCPSGRLQVIITVEIADIL